MIFFFKEKIKLQLETLQLYLFILPLKKLGNHLAMDWQKSNNFEKSKKKALSVKVNKPGTIIHHNSSKL